MFSGNITIFGVRPWAMPVFARRLNGVMPTCKLRIFITTLTRKFRRVRLHLRLIEKYKMNLDKILDRKIPKAWDGIDKIPWNDPDFSRRVLRHHLSQDHDMASRRFSLIEQHLRWLIDRFPEKNARILDFCCGPGLYLHTLAALGFQCTGVDFSPASIQFAKDRAEKEGLEIEYVLADLREYVPSGGFDCVTMIFGEFNAFQPSVAAAILRKTATALVPGGLLILEPHTFAAVKECGQSPPSWATFIKQGLFSDRPHICLQKNFWDEQLAAATSLYYIIDVETADLSEYGSSIKAYTETEYRTMLREAGFTDPEILPPEIWPGGKEYDGQLLTFVARKES